MTAKRTPEDLVRDFQSGLEAIGIDTMNIYTRPLLERFLAALREQAEVAREERAAAREEGFRDMTAAMMNGLRRHVMAGCLFKACTPACHESDQHLLLHLADRLRLRGLTGLGEPPQERPRIGGQPDGECPHGCLHKECRA